MPTIPIVTKAGPRTYPVVEAVTGGQLVEGRTTGDGGVGVAGAGSLKYLGVAVGDAVPASSISTTPTMVGGRPVLNAAILPTSVAVADSGMEVPVTYAAAAAFGEPLVAASGGRVTPAGATPDARTIVGICAEPGGVAAANTVALFRTR